MIELDRVLPNNLEAERAILGVILQHRPALFEASGLLQADDFYMESHRAIYAAFLTLDSEQSGIDILTVKNELRRADKLEMCGGAAYISSLTEGIPGALKITPYAKMVKECSCLRKIIQTGNDAMMRAYSGEEKSDQIIQDIQSELLKLTQLQNKKGFVSAADYAYDAFNEIERLRSQKVEYGGLDTGFSALNRLTQGFHPQQLIIIAGRPGHGKTSIAQNIVDNLALRRGKRIGVFSLEMGGVELVKRTICSESPVDNYEMLHGSIDWRRIAEVCGEIYQSKLWIDESAGLSISELRSRAQWLAIENNGLDMLVVDYLQLMSGSGRKGDNREREISEISRGLKVLAKDLNIPIIALSQLNREIEKTNRKPLLSDLRESGSLEQDADVVLFIWREEMKLKTDSNEGLAELIIAKQRNGKSGVTVDLEFDKRYCRFRDR